MGAWAGNPCGYYSTLIGDRANATSSSLQNSMALGYSSVVDAGNKVRIGNTSVNSIGGQVGWSNYSDERIKKNIIDNVFGLAFIKLLRPVIYNYDVKKENRLLGNSDSEEWEGKYDIEKIKFSGFLAQEVETAPKKINYDFSGIDKTGRIMGLRYAEFVVPLVKAAQELSAENDAKNSKIEELENRLKRLETLISKENSWGTNKGYLRQNVPNPVTSCSSIGYSIPANGQIRITDIKGSILKTYRVDKGQGQISINTEEFAAGIYSYTLFVNDNKIDSKQMVITK